MLCVQFRSRPNSRAGRPGAAERALTQLLTLALSLNREELVHVSSAVEDLSGVVRLQAKGTLVSLETHHAASLMLPLVRRLVEAQRGEIRVGADEETLEFCVILPALRRVRSRAAQAMRASD
jgi:hypothetical protein